MNLYLQLQLHWRHPGGRQSEGGGGRGEGVCGGREGVCGGMGRREREEVWVKGGWGGKLSEEVGETIT